MRLLNLITSGAALLLLVPIVVSAQLARSASAGPVQAFLTNLLTFTQSVLIPFILGIGFLVFVWGMFKFFILGGANDDAKDQGKSLMVYSVLGFVLIITFWGLVNLFSNSTGLKGGQINTTSLKVPTF